MRTTLSAVCLAAAALPSHATELNYHFVSPDMGGNPLNGTYLLNQASEQNNFKDPAALKGSTYKPKSALEQFKSNLQSAILGQVSRSSVQSMFDSKGNIITGTDLNFDLNGDGNPDFSVIVGDVVNGNVSITISDGISDTVLTVPYKPIN